MANLDYDPYKWTLRTVVENNFFEVPFYQRPYTWSADEVDVLLDDLFGAFSLNKQTKNNSMFTGYLFLRKSGMGKDGVKVKYEVVDGQQRLTTFSMLLISIYSLALKRKFSEIKDKEISDLKSYLWKYSSNDRTYNKDERLITLSSIDKSVGEYLFDNAFANPKKILPTIAKYNTCCRTEDNYISMFKRIMARLEKEIPEDPTNNNLEILNFLTYILDNVVFIAIQSSIDMAKVFSVFESINSKGKPLDDIDQIKTYIFSELDENDYDTYLQKWGQLIIKTDDSLADYLKIYIRAYYAFYRNNINLIYFKSLAKKTLCKNGSVPIADGLKNLIDGMLEQADNYKLLYDIDGACKAINSSKFKPFYMIYNIIKYEHPRSLFFRAFCEFNKLDANGNRSLKKDDVTKVVKSAVLFMLKAQSIKGGDSKDALSYYETIADNIYTNNKVDSSFINKTFTDALTIEGINETVITSSFMSMDFYSKHDLAYVVLSLCESIDDTNGDKLIYDQVSLILSHVGDKTFDIDHMLPQTPDGTEPNLYYYCDKTSGEELLKLKPGHDFPADVFDGMKYDEFKSRTVHRIGNIRLYLKSLNCGKGNGITKLPGHVDFTTHKQILDRCEELAKLLCNSPDLQ